MEYWRRYCRLTFLGRIRNEERKEKMNIAAIIDDIIIAMVRIFSYDECYPVAKKTLDVMTPTTKERGRPKAIWAQRTQEVLDSH